MIAKIKDNLAIIVTSFTLLGSIGAGLSTAGEIVNKLQGIDDRMNFVEQEFGRLKEETMVSSDISVLYEKVYQLELVSNQADQFREQVAYMQSQLQTLEQTIRDEGFDTQNKYIPEKWEWQDLNDSITRIETLNQTIVNKQWEIDDLKTRLAYLEANNHNH